MISNPNLNQAADLSKKSIHREDQSIYTEAADKAKHGHRRRIA